MKVAEKIPEVLQNNEWDFKEIGQTKNEKQIKVFAPVKEILQKIGQEIKKCEARLNDTVGQAVGQDLNKLTEEFKNISKKLYELNKYEKEKSKKNFR